jgi:N-methylhydantoinase A
VGYEVVRSLYQRFSSFDVGAVNALLDDMAREASDVVAQGSFGAEIGQTRVAFMRYVGQGHEIPVPLPARTLLDADVALIRAAYDREYARFYDRPVPGSDVEIMSYAVVVATILAAPATDLAEPEPYAATVDRTQQVRDTTSGEVSAWAIYDRTSLRPGATLPGPAIIAEDETSTLVGPGWSARIEAHGYIEMTRKSA